MAGSNVVTKSFTATGQSDNFDPFADNFGASRFNLTISGTFVATIRLERSFDEGSTWHPCTRSDGSSRTWAAPMSIIVSEVEAGVLYRLNCTAFTSGTAVCRLSQ
jgi:hypothetical protein